MSVARRRFIQGTAVATGAALLPTVPAYAADPVTIEADGITLVGRGDGSVLVRDGAGTDRILLSHFMIKDTALGQQRTFGGTPPGSRSRTGGPRSRSRTRWGAARPESRCAEPSTSPLARHT